MEQAAIIITSAEGSELSQLCKVLSENHILYLPVVDGSGKPVGLVTKNSLWQALNISSQEFVSQSENCRETKNYRVSSTTTSNSSESSLFRLLLEKRFVDIILSDSETALQATLINKTEVLPTANVATVKNSQNDIFSGKETPDLAEEKLLLQLSLEKANKAIIIADKNGLILHCNQLALQIYNKPKEELINKPLRGIIQKLNPQLIAEIEQYLQTKDDWESETIIKNNDDYDIVIYMTYSIIKNDLGEISGIIHTCTDLGEKKEHSEALTESQTEAIQSSTKESLTLTALDFFDSLSSNTPTFKSLMLFNNHFFKSVFEPPGLGQYQNFEQGNPSVKKISKFDLRISQDPPFIESSYKHTSVDLLKEVDSQQTTDNDHLALSQPQPTQQQLEQLMEATGTIMYKAEIDGNFIIKTISQSCFAIVGYEPQEIINNPQLWVSKIHPDDRILIDQEILSPTKQKRRIDYRFLCKNGNYCWLRDEGQLIFDSAGKPTEISGTCQEISELKILEEKVEKVSEKETELSELRRQFITITSHEFRTPLCTILSSADLLELYIERGRTEKQKEHIDRIQASALRISNLLNDILVTGKGISGQIKCNPTLLNLEYFCQKIIQTISLSFSLLQDRIQFIKIGNFDNAGVDGKLVEQMLLNLLSNAVKYSSLDTHILFELNCSQPTTVVFKIQDFGIGIPSNDIPHIFDAFYRGSNLNNQGGTGLGLTIVKQAADAHKAEITVESVVGAGTTFTVTMPVWTEPAI